MKAKLSWPVRIFTISVVMYVANVSRHRLWIVFNVLTPVVYGLIALFLFSSAGKPQQMLHAAVGAGIMGIWTAVLFGAGDMLQDMRWMGVLEPLIITPPPLILVLSAFTLGTAVVGLYSMVATVACGMLFFGVKPDFVSPTAFVLALVVCLLAMAAVGMLMATTFVLMRNAMTLANTLDHPVWLLSGMLTGVSLLPGWLDPIAYALPTTWGARAVHRAIDGRPVLALSLAALALSAVYVALACATTRYVERRARKSATLALA
ncbi:ABC transporter permease [Streptomyces sp. NPDC004230]